MPREEVDHWIDLDPALAAHLFQVAQWIGRARAAGVEPGRIGVLIVGDEVPHTHLHVVPINHPNELSFAHIDRDARRPKRWTTRPRASRAALREIGAPGVDGD